MFLEPIAWNPTLYERFLDWRTQPSKDLANRIHAEDPQTVVDLGCGTGNSTAICAQRWPASAITGVDNSVEMLAQARESFVPAEWRLSDIQSWLQTNEQTDVIFSSSALHWVQPHHQVFPHLLERLSPGGILAVQMPDYASAAHATLRQLILSPEWQPIFAANPPKEWISHPLSTYFDILANRTRHLEMWRTEYQYEVSGISDIVQWYSATGLRPYQTAVNDPVKWDRFLDCFATALDPVFPKTRLGSRLFAIPRLFLIAYRKDSW